VAQQFLWSRLALAAADNSNHQIRRTWSRTGIKGLGSLLEHIMQEIDYFVICDLTILMKTSHNHTGSNGTGRNYRSPLETRLKLVAIVSTRYLVPANGSVPIPARYGIIRDKTTSKDSCLSITSTGLFVFYTYRT
jgi:hypothetical protein